MNHVLNMGLKKVFCQKEKLLFFKMQLSLRYRTKNYKWALSPLEQLGSSKVFCFLLSASELNSFKPVFHLLYGFADHINVVSKSLCFC